MDERELDKRLSLLEHKIESIDTQLKRLVSHFESEQNNRNESGKRINSLEFHYQKIIQPMLEKFDKILINGGTGLAIRMDRIEQREKESNKNLYKWISIISILVSVGLGIFTVISKT